EGRTVTVTIVDGSGNVTGSYSTTVTGGTWQVNISAASAKALVDGSYTVTATTTNAAGTLAQASASILVDETPPAAPGITLTDNSGSVHHLTNEITPTLTINAEAGSTVQVYHDSVLVRTPTPTPPPLL